jgi:sugar phosphate isomerase/epimerase
VSQTEVPLVFWAANAMRHSPLERAAAAAAGGFDAISLFTPEAPACAEANGWTLPQLGRELASRGAPVSTLDPYLGWYPGFDPDAEGVETADLLRASQEEVLRYGAELEAPFLTLVGPFGGPDAEFDEIVESLAAFVDAAAAAGIRPHLEVVPTSKVPDLATAMALIDAVGRDELGLLLDTLHLARGGGKPADLESVPRERIFAIQLCDAPAEPITTDYMEEILHFRELPGDGGLDLDGYLRVLLAKGDLPPTGPEVFSDRLGALSAHDSALECGRKCRDFLDSVGAATRSPTGTGG